MKAIIVTFLTILIFSCKVKNENQKTSIFSDKNLVARKMDSTPNASEILDAYLHGTNVLVALHRSGWRHAPENSMLAIQQAIKMGVDIIEIDLCKTKDGEVILMHDRTLDRTTSGSGFVKDYTLEEIKKLNLRDGGGHIVKYKVPTLREVLIEAKGKVLINLDKSFEIFDDVLPILKETGTLNQVIIKGYDIPYKEVKEKFGIYLDSVQYMPIIKLGAKGYEVLLQEVKNKHFEGVEFTFESDTIPIVNQFYEFEKKGTRVWVNALWPEHNAGHDDDKALDDPDGSYGWLISKGINIIQTDRPQLLLEYLRKKNLHN